MLDKIVEICDFKQKGSQIVNEIIHALAHVAS